VSPEERDRIVALGRKRGAELAHLAAKKADVLRALGWPAAVAEVQKRSAF
jgi:hypothetical protein